MAMQLHWPPGGCGRHWKIRPVSLDQLGECQCGLCHSFGLRCAKQRRHLVTKRQGAGRLQPDDAHAASCQRIERRHQPFGLGARLVDHARREIGPAAAIGTSSCRCRGEHIIAGGTKHPDCGAQIFRFEIAVEGISEQNHRGSGSGRGRSDLAVAEGVAVPFRQ